MLDHGKLRAPSNVFNVPSQADPQLRGSYLFHFSATKGKISTMQWFNPWAQDMHEKKIHNLHRGNFKFLSCYLKIFEYG